MAILPETFNVQELLFSGLKGPQDNLSKVLLFSQKKVLFIQEYLVYTFIYN